MSNKTGNEYNPLEDGYTHINQYSKARTQLGRLLSNFTRTPFDHPEHGYFASMEAFYFYVSTGFMHQNIRDKDGFEAKKEGVKHPRFPIDNFMQIIESGIRAKVRCNENIQKALIDSTLPFAHYYWYGEADQQPKVIVPKQHQWLVTLYEKIRSELKKGEFV